MENPFEKIDERLARIENLLENIYSIIGSEKASIVPSKIMDIGQLSNYLGLSKSHIYKLTSTHTIPHSKRGKKLYFEKEAINGWILENKVWNQDDIEKEVVDYFIKKGKHFKGE
ncbi:excisionase family DNA binding protein [Oceanihabitans sediminis]|uniref:DNA-binding protein n=1 Tax=Oceanihabitans sediminis TaxID=1812012 RepID=A0A368P555_9FLAO|nr:helix-turn-helix domain-containing protein [Oceanihabitans sediminis]RBP30967.1 excisionase family DNA binding protein [Oceanihabitans sediminis]RCU56919.1 DNA-binding protein [Oceanihabitans sediminis]